MIEPKTTQADMRDAPFLEQAYTIKKPYNRLKMVARLHYRGYSKVFYTKKEGGAELDELRRKYPLTPRKSHVFAVMEPDVRHFVEGWMAKINQKEIQ